MKRIVVTGMGAITPVGNDVTSFWNSTVNGCNGVVPITSFDTTDFRTHVGGEVKNFSPETLLSKEQCAAMGRSSQFAVVAAQEALASSGLDVDTEDPYRLGISTGTTMGEPQILEQGIDIAYKTGNAENIPPQLPRQYPCNAITTNLARVLNFLGPNIMIPTACAAGNYAIGYAFDCIRQGCIDVALAGGSDPFSRIAFTGFNRLLATTREVCRPFDLNRDGMAVGEGAGMLVIEELEHAKKRNAPILAEILGYGLGCDAYKMTIPDPSGSGGIIALQRALQNAQIHAADIDFICAHGTGTGENDKTETHIIKTVLGKHARQIPVASLKSMTGHTMGAASAIEAVASVLALHHSIVFPTIHYRDPDPECDLDYVPNQAREKNISIVVSNAYAFGGNTSSLVLSRFRG